MTVAAAPVNDRREIFGWTMYDWANSAFSTTIGAVFFGPYFASLAEAVANADGYINVLGFPVDFNSIFPFLVSLSVVMQVVFLPVLGAIADYSNLRKRMLVIFATIGATATALMFFMTQPLWWAGGVLYVLANVAFGAAIVFYNAYLPDIASPDQRDRVSSLGFGLGYLGGGLLLLFNLIFFLTGPDMLGLDTGLVVRINLASAGLWWLLFSQVTFRRLRERAAIRAVPEGYTYITIGFKQLRDTLREIRNYPQTVRYLIAYLVYNDGVQTVIAMSAVFAAQELGLGFEVLAPVILMVQFVAFGGAMLFNWIAARISAKRSIMIMLVIWIGLTAYTWAFLRTAEGFWLVGFGIALVLGGTQALSRSIFSQMIPNGREAEFFSFYEISERGTSWLGPLVFGLVNQLTGSLRLGILSVAAFFIVGMVLLAPVDIRKAIEEAGNEIDLYTSRPAIRPVDPEDVAAAYTDTDTDA